MKRFSKHWRYPLRLAAIVLAVWWLFFGYRYGFIYNHGHSMEPTHSNGDMLIIEKARYLGKKWTPDRTDVIVIRDTESGDNLTKRVIALEGETVVIKNGYHPCVVAPGYEMYYFTILGGLSQRSLIQYFQPEHAYQIETIPGIKDMIAKYK